MGVSVVDLKRLPLWQLLPAECAKTLSKNCPAHMLTEEISPTTAGILPPSVCKSLKWCILGVVLC